MGQNKLGFVSGDLFGDLAKWMRWMARMLRIYPQYTDIKQKAADKMTKPRSVTPGKVQDRAKWTGLCYNDGGTESTMRQQLTDLAEYAEQEWQAAMEKELNARPALKVILAEQENETEGRKLVERQEGVEEDPDGPEYTWEVLESNPPTYRRVKKSKYETKCNVL